jgi:hypothetical protein
MQDPFLTRRLTMSKPIRYLDDVEQPYRQRGATFCYYAFDQQVCIVEIERYDPDPVLFADTTADARTYAKTMNRARLGLEPTAVAQIFARSLASQDVRGA